MFTGSHICGIFLDRLEEVVVLVLFNHHSNQAILRHKLRTANTKATLHISMWATLFYFTKT